MFEFPAVIHLIGGIAGIITATLAVLVLVFDPDHIL